MTPHLIAPKRGTVDATTLKPNPLSDKPQTFFAQVERGHDERAGMRLMRYTIPYEFDYTDIPTCTAAGGVSAGAGATVSLPQIPATSRILGVVAEVVTAFTNDAAGGSTADIDAVALNTDVVLADAAITASAGVFKAPEFTLAAVSSGVDPDAITYVFPKKYSVLVTPKVYFAGADTVKYTAGKMRLFVEVLSYFEA
jgi:hypothetical protein